MAPIACCSPAGKKETSANPRCSRVESRPLMAADHELSDQRSSACVYNRSSGQYSCPPWTTRITRRSDAVSSTAHVGMSRPKRADLEEASSSETDLRSSPDASRVKVTEYA